MEKVNKLRPCPHCGKSIARLASKCPNCGGGVTPAFSAWEMAGITAGGLAGTFVFVWVVIGVIEAVFY